MSMINVSFDTTSRKIDITLDGQSLSNVREVLFYVFNQETDDGKVKQAGSVDIVQVEYDDSNKIEKVTKLYASENKDKALPLQHLEQECANQRSQLESACAKWLGKK